MKNTLGEQAEKNNRSPDGKFGIKPSRNTLLLCMGGIFIGTLLIYARAVDFLFVYWDDPAYIYDNPAVNPPSWQNIAFTWTNIYNEIYLPILTTLQNFLAYLALHMSSARDHALNGTTLNPSIFHFANIFFHAASSSALFALLFKLTKSMIGSLVGAILFAIHPLNVETVAWCSSLDHDMCALLEFAALYLYVSHAENSSDLVSVRTFRAKYFGAVILGVLAMFVMPIAIVIPITALIIDILILRRFWRTSLLECGVWLVLVVPFILVTLQGGTVNPRFNVPLWQRPFVAGDAVAFYIAKLFVPINLVIDYGRQPISVMSHWWGYATWLLPAAFLLLSLFVRKTSPWLLAGILIFIVNILPVSGLIPFGYQAYSTVADRYAYLAIPGISIILAFWIGRMQNPQRIIPAACLICVCFLSLTEIQLGYWRNSLKLFDHTISVKPGSRAAYSNYGTVMLDLGNTDMAMKYFLKYIQIVPGSPLGYFGIGKICALHGDHTDAITNFKYAISVDPTSPLARLSLAIEYSKIGDTHDAEIQYEFAENSTPHIPFIHQGLADVFQTEGRYAAAAAEYRKASDLDPDNATDHSSLGQMLMNTGDIDGGCAEYAKAIALMPNAALLHFKYGDALEADKKLPEAETQFRAAVSLDPKLDQAHENLGIALAKSGDSKNSVGEFQTAVTLSPKNPSYRRNLARILIMTGNKAKAADNLLELLSQNPDDQVANAMLGSLRGK